MLFRTHELDDLVEFRIVFFTDRRDREHVDRFERAFQHFKNGRGFSFKAGHVVVVQKRESVVELVEYLYDMVYQHLEVRIIFVDVAFGYGL